MVSSCQPRSAASASCSSRTLSIAVQGTLIAERAPHRTVRAQFGHTACMGVSLSRVHHAIFVVLCCFILLFDPRREHSFVPTAYHHRRCAQRRLRTALVQRRRRLVLDQREHGGRLPVIGWLPRDDPRGACHWPRAIAANHACIRLNPYRVPTMKQSYASAGKAPRRRVHSPSGIAAIAVYGLPPPRIVIGYRASSAVSAEPCLSFLVLQYCSRRRPQLDTVRYLTGRDQAPQRYQQLARQCHDHCRLARAARPLGPRAIPPRQRTVFLEH